MPQVPGAPNDPLNGVGEIPTIDASEIDDFLKFLFFDIARRPAQLNMRETMRVARYLDWLAQAGVPKQVVKKGPDAVREHRVHVPSAEERDKKRCVQHLADLLWNRVRAMHADQAASNFKTLGFLKAHQHTHFANPFILRALELVQEYDVPAGEIQVHRTPNLVSSSLAAFGGDPRLQSDLSERLVAARGALKKCGLSRFQRKIAAALKACGVKPARRSKHDPGNEEWSPEDIHDLVRAFENRVRKRILKPPGKTLRDLVAAECERVTIRWVRTYREACEFERRSGAVTEPPET